MKYVSILLCVLCVTCVLATAQPQSTIQKGETPPQPPKNGISAPPASPPQSQPASAAPSEDFVIGPEDVLEISVWREPDLTMKAVVRPDGKIGVRLLNDVQASGLTTKQLQDRLQTDFSRFVSEPVVTVIITEVRSQMVHIIGSVPRPGVYPLGAPLTVMEILARAGGLADFAKKEEIAIVRTEGGKTQRLLFNYKAFVEGKNLQQNIQMKNGDVIVVP